MASYIAARHDLITVSEAGLFCRKGGFHIDPWQPVDRAVITHGHSDHARWGMKRYLAASPSAGILQRRLAPDASIETMPYGQSITIGEVTVSFHPAGHILGSAQVRVECKGETWVVTGDCKVEADPTCAPFEIVPCDTLITESTFALPVYRWPDPDAVAADINTWWRANQRLGRTSIVFAYSLGKAQRVIARLDPDIGPILTHGSVQRLNEVYRAAGIHLPETQYAMSAPKAEMRQSIVIAPPGAQESGWLRRFAPYSLSFASGWMLVRGQRRRRSVDRGFVISDHADWGGLLDIVRGTGASRVLPTHGYTDQFARYLRENGLDATALPTRFSGEGREEEGSDDVTGEEG